MPDERKKASSTEDWLQNAKIQQTIQPQKLMLLTQLLGQSNMKSKEELIPFFVTAAAKANSMGMAFSDEETETILSVLKENMSPQDRSRVDTIRQLAKLISNKKS